ncbi:MAG TPA: HAD family hydrolase [Acidimicrobiales bacterium]
MTAQLDAVLFDAGGVLVLPDPTVLGPLLAPYGADQSVDALTRAHYAGVAAQDQPGLEHDDWPAYNEAYVRRAGVPEHEVAEAALLLGRTRSAMLWRYPIADSCVALRLLHEGGVPIGVVSNASGQIEATLRRFGVCQVDDGDGVPVLIVVDSHHVGVQKPDPGVFTPALEVLGLDPARVGYVGDSIRNDVVGATAAGMRPFLVDPFDDRAGSAFADYPPFTRVHSLHELLPLTSAA